MDERQRIMLIHVTSKMMLGMMAIEERHGENPVTRNGIMHGELVLKKLLAGEDPSPLIDQHKRDHNEFMKQLASSN